MLKFREGDFFQISDGSIFEVKSLVHPPKRVIAFIRYLQDSKGNRNINQKKYTKYYSIEERFRVLKERYPNFLVYDKIFNDYMPEVPYSYIKKQYIPTKGLERLRKQEDLNILQKKALLCTEIIVDEADLKKESLGITGSILVGIDTEASDIDIIVYGVEDGFKVHRIMKNLFEKNPLFCQYENEGLQRLYSFRVRDTVMSFDDFIKHEKRKSLQGIFDGTDFYIRCIKNWSEVHEEYGDIIYKPEGYSRIIAKVVDDSESIFTPCNYEVEDVEFLDGKKVENLQSISSFRGRFCEQAIDGETVMAQGKLEKLTQEDKEHFRLLLGGNPQDFMITL